MERAPLSKTVKRSLAAANQTYSYDLDGNLLSDGIWNYTWDAENRLIEAEYLLAATDVEKRKLHYIYDHQSRRILRRELHWNTARNTWYAERQTKYIYDGWNCIAEILNESTLWKTHTWGLDLGSSDGYASTAGDGATTASGGGVQAFQTAGGVGGLLATEDLLNNYTAAPAYDGNGNLTALIAKGTDTLLAEYEYTAFGETLTAKGPHAQNNSYRFSTKPLDTDTGLYYYGYRYYDPTAGRWPSRDPIEEEGGPNLYGFVSNDPISYFDILGNIVYGIDGTWANANIGQVTNTKRFVDDVLEETAEYTPGPGGSSTGFSRLYAGLTGAGSSAIKNQVVSDICKAYCKGDCKVGLVGWSRGAVIAMGVAKDLKDIGCKCDGKVIKPISVRFVGLFDAVQMMIGGWPQSVPSNVKHFAHAKKTDKAGQWYFPTKNYRGTSRHFNLINPITRRVRRCVGPPHRRRCHWRTISSYKSSHSDIGASDTTTHAYSWIKGQARAAGIKLK